MFDPQKFLSDLLSGSVNGLDLLAYIVGGVVLLVLWVLLTGTDDREDEVWEARERRRWERERARRKRHRQREKYREQDRKD